jgi:hypothetical protein
MPPVSDSSWYPGNQASVRQRPPAPITDLSPNFGDGLKDQAAVWA